MAWQRKVLIPMWWWGCLCGSNLYGMSGTDTSDVLCGTDVVKVVSVRQKILLTGTAGMS